MELCTRHLDTTLRLEGLTHLHSKCFIVAGIARPLQDLAENAQEVFLDRAMFLLKFLQFLAGGLPGLSHPRQEHFDQLVTRGGPGFVQEAEQQRIAFPWLANIAQVSNFKSSRLGLKLPYLGPNPT